MVSTKFETTCAPLCLYCAALLQTLLNHLSFHIDPVFVTRLSDPSGQSAWFRAHPRRRHTGGARSSVAQPTRSQEGTDCTQKDEQVGKCGSQRDLPASGPSSGLSRWSSPSSQEGAGGRSFQGAWGRVGPALAPPAQAQLPAHPEAEGGAQPLDILSRLGILDAPHAPDPPHPRFRGRHVR